MSKTHTGWKWWIAVAGVFAIVFLGLAFALDQYYLRTRVAEFSSRFKLLGELRRDALRGYFDTVRTEITFWSMNADVLTIQKELVREWRRLERQVGDPGTTLRPLYLENNPFPPGRRRELSDPGDGSSYSAVHARIHPLARLFVVERRYYDFFLIDPEGNILYSVEKESDFATSLVHGPWKDMGLSDVFRQAIAGHEHGESAFSDFSSYPPSNDAPAMFAARAMADAEGTVLGVLALQVPTDHIQEIMHFTAGMGETGETYLVGQDKLMRSDSRFSKESTILRTMVDTETGRLALRGESGVSFTDDYRGVRVLSAYTYADIHGVRWAVLAEMDEEEVVQDLADDRTVFSASLTLLYAVSLLLAWFVRSGEVSAGGLNALEADLPVTED